jgi:hypothetical protein
MRLYIHPNQTTTQPLSGRIVKLIRKVGDGVMLREGGSDVGLLPNEITTARVGGLRIRRTTVQVLERLAALKHNKYTHGYPYGRGGADSYYRRGMKPHMWVWNTTGERLTITDLLPEERNHYMEGYRLNEEAVCHKEWT